MRNILSTILMVCLMMMQLKAQDSSHVERQKPPPFKERIVWGGNIGLSFGSVTSIGAAPVIGYKVNQRFIPGIGFSYYYNKFHFQNQIPEVSHVYGGSVWARFYLMDRIFLHGEIETLNAEWDPYGRPDVRSFRDSYLLGGGYREMYGNISSYILVLYVLNVEESAYYYPLVIRAGFAFGM